MTQPTSPTIRIVLVDDHPVVRDGLAALIATQEDLLLIGQASGGHEALAVARTLRPDLLITDLRMEHGDGTMLIKELRRADPELMILVLTTYGSESDLGPALDAGATSFLLKDSSRQELFAAIRATSRGESVLSPAVAGLLIRRHRAGGSAEETSLSPRELEILRQVAEGLTNKEIGRLLHISEATVKTHLVRLYAKLGTADRAAAVSQAYRRGLLPLPET